MPKREQRILRKRLTDESEYILNQFTSLVMTTKMWLKNESPYSPEDVKDALKCTILKDASDFDSIFHILNDRNVWSWYSFHLLKRIIDPLSPTGSELFNKFKKYEEKFKAFCKRSLFECPDLIANYDPEYHIPLFVKVGLADEEFKNPSLMYLRENFQDTLASIIEVEDRDLVLLTYQDGCTQLIYSLPRAVAKKAFPLSQEQREMLLKMGVLECYLFPDGPVDEVSLRIIFPLSCT